MNNHLDLDLVEGTGYTRTQGRGRVDVEPTFTRNLEPADIEMLSAEGRVVVPQTLKSLKDSHHRIAQLLAMGLRPWEISSQTGTTVNRISILQADPTFDELVSHYRKQIQDGVIVKAVDIVERYSAFTVDAMQELHRRLDESPDEFTVGTLTEAIKTFGDRAGAGPVNKSININVDMADRLAAARKRAGLDQVALPSTRSVSEPRPNATKVIDEI